MSIEVLRELWKQHLDEKFPRGLGGEEIDGIDLALLDTYTAGCVDGFLAGRLDADRLAILEKCSRELQAVCPKLSGLGRTYFERLRDVASLSLSEVKKRAV
jgi:hypothetical protein